LGLSLPEAARLLDHSDRHISHYDKLEAVSRSTELAMLALEYLPSWRLAELGINPFWRQK